ncbi:hypothetical protein MYAM1_000972 [Malassezia yamatoensis]|uniref:Ribosomal protein n=1 Tax=Malassezia yamatoensis TaxID=253288 RepID=A0AAJ6CFE8_9BASI|nr:hypothetical protein MYAM1_000972 [Malassezia yamatoensis]
MLLGLLRERFAAPVRNFSSSSQAWKKARSGRGRARKSPATLLRLHAEGKLKGAEAATAAKLLAEKSNTSVEATNERTGIKSLTLGEARNIIRSLEAARPRNAYELHIVTNVPSNQTNAFRGRIVFPKEPRIKGEVVLVFAEQGTDAAAAAHKSAEELQTSGSSTQLIIGGSEMIADAASGRVPAYTRVLSTAALLPSLSRALARTLGPRGLMPSAKRGTVVEDGEEMQNAIRNLLTGVDWRGDRNGVVRGAVGRIAFSEEDLRKNVETLLDAVIEKAVSGLGGTKTSAHVIAGYSRDTEAVDASGQKTLTRTPGAMKRAGKSDPQHTKALKNPKQSIVFSISMKSAIALGVFLAAAATVLLGFATFCTPVFHKLWLLETTFPQQQIHWGTLGYEARNLFTPRHLGYPRTFGLAALTFLLALAGFFAPVVVGSIIVLLSLLACAVAITAFVIVIVVYFILKRHFKNDATSFKFGTAFWLTVAAAIALLLASMLFGLGCCCSIGRGRRRKEHYSDDAAMYNRMFVPEHEPMPTADERINMDHMEPPVQQPTQTVAYNQPKTSPYESSAVATGQNNYYSSPQDTYNDRSGLSVVPQHNTSENSQSVIVPITDRSQQTKGTGLTSESETPQETFNSRRSTGPTSSHLHSIDGSEYDDAATAPTHLGNDATTTGTGYDNASPATTGYGNASSTTRATDSSAGNNTVAIPRDATNTVGIPASRIGAYDPEPALPSHLRSTNTASQQSRDSWFLPGSTSATSPASRTNDSGLPSYLSGNTNTNTYPQEKRSGALS